jgi:Xaa-Pro aminopeptidase
VSIDSHARSSARLDRVRDALASLNVDALVVTYPPNVRYLTGLSATAGAVIVSPAAGVLIVDFRYLTVAQELIAAPDGPPVELQAVAGSYDQTIVDVLSRLASQRIGIEATSLSVARFNRLSALLSARAGGESRECPALVSTERVIERHRLIKDAGEQAILRDAARRLSAVARLAPAFVRPGRTELKIAGDIDAAIRRAGFERPAFETIVASGPNGARPHARPGLRRVQAGEGVMLDFGGVYDGYCVDLTRTLFVGAPDPAFRRLFDAVARAHAAALAVVRPGVATCDIDAAARRVLEAHGLGEAFGHGTGHGLGLEVHEEPRIAKATDTEPSTNVEAGMVFTIEPGAYVPELGGVRIEDDVLVVPGGCEVLTDVPIELSAVSFPPSVES